MALFTVRRFKFKISVKIYISFLVNVNGQQITKNNCEILIVERSAKIRWADNTGNIPSNAVRAGKSPSGNSVYIGRSKLTNDVKVGEIKRKGGTISASFSQKPSELFEILTDKSE